MTKNDGRLSEITHTRRNPRTSFLQFAAIVYSEERMNQRKFTIAKCYRYLNRNTKPDVYKKQTGMKGLLSLPDWSPIIQVYFIHSPAKSSCFLLLRIFSASEI